jgi:hypothetical protein
MTRADRIGTLFGIFDTLLLEELYQSAGLGWRMILKDRGCLGISNTMGRRKGTRET